MSVLVQASRASRGFTEALYREEESFAKGWSKSPRALDRFLGHCLCTVIFIPLHTTWIVSAIATTVLESLVQGDYLRAVSAASLGVDLCLGLLLIPRITAACFLSNLVCKLAWMIIDIEKKKKQGYVWT